MRESLLELGIQSVLVLLYGIGALGAGIAGILIEHRSIAYFLAGEYQLGVWVGIIGLVALFTAYLIITDKLQPAVARVA